MIGLLFLATIAAWLWASFWLSIKVGRLIAKPLLSGTATILTFVALLCLPFVDEVIGKHQFETLCKVNGIESADVSKARGKKVKVEYGGRELLEGTILPIQESNVLFKDADSGEVLIRHKNYYARGGWLMRYTFFSLGDSHPMLFGGFCDRQIEQEIFKTNLITFLYE